MNHHSGNLGNVGGEIATDEDMWSFDQGPRHVRSWCTANGVADGRKAVVMGVVHGLGDHAGRFDQPARWLAHRGVHVYCYDQIGHGKSPGRRVAIPSYRYLLDDVESFSRLLQRRHPDASVGLLGQSMGGNLVLNHQLRGYPRLPWVIAGSPMLRAVNPPDALRMFALRLLATCAPNFNLQTPVDPSALSRDLSVQRAYLEDRLVEKQVSLRLGGELIDSGAWALRNARQLATPTLLTHGAADLITCHRATSEFAGLADSNTTLKIWPDGAHDLHHDIVRDEYLEFVLGWVLEQVDDAAPA